MQWTTMHGNELSGRIVTTYNYIVPIQNFNNNTVQIVCYKEKGEPQGCQPDDIIIFFFLLFSFKFYYVAVVFSLSIISDDFEIIIL